MCQPGKPCGVPRVPDTRGMLRMAPKGSHPLCNVRVIPISTKRPLKVGDILARDGAWNRKYKVLGISVGTEPHTGAEAWLIQLESLGSFFATGKVDLPKRRSVRELWQHKYTEEEMARGSHGSRWRGHVFALFGYWRVAAIKD